MRAKKQNHLIGKRVKELRERRGLTQTELGYISGIPQNRISNWELEYHNPSLENIVPLCKALGCSADELFGLSELQLNERELWCLMNFRKLGVERQKAVCDLIATLQGFVPADE